jgi:hypothetical protein
MQPAIHPNLSFHHRGRCSLKEKSIDNRLWIMREESSSFPIPQQQQQQQHSVEKDKTVDSPKNIELRLRVPTIEDMEDIGGLLASVLLEEENDEEKCSNLGITLLLRGDLGAGKTTLVRGFLRTATGDSQLCVTSPTYLLSNTYYSYHNHDGSRHREDNNGDETMRRPLE